MSKHNNFFPCRWTTRNLERISRIRIHTHFHDPRRMETTRRGSWKGRRRRGGSSALSTGPAYWSPVRRGHTPFAGSRLFMARDSCGRQPASQPAASKTRGGGGGNYGSSHENRSRSESWNTKGCCSWKRSLYHGNIAKCDKDRKDGGRERIFSSLFWFDRMEMNEGRIIRIEILNLLYSSWNEAKEHFFLYIFIRCEGWINT